MFWRKKDATPPGRDGVAEATARSNEEWMVVLMGAKARAILAATDAREPTEGVNAPDILNDLRIAKAAWCRREYEWLLMSALRHGVLDGEKHDRVTGELPFSALGWPRC